MRELVEWLPAFVSVVVFLGAAIVYLRGSRDKGTIATLERSNAALTERVLLLEKNETQMTVRIDTLEAENLVLQRIANSGDAIAALALSLDEHHRQAMTAWNLIHQDLRSLTDEEETDR